MSLVAFPVVGSRLQSLVFRFEFGHPSQESFALQRQIVHRSFSIQPHA
jgi:hypothetical protein